MNAQDLHLAQQGPMTVISGSYVGLHDRVPRVRTFVPLTFWTNDRDTELIFTFCLDAGAMRSFAIERFLNYAVVRNASWEDILPVFPNPELHPHLIAPSESVLRVVSWRKQPRLTWIPQDWLERAQNKGYFVCRTEVEKETPQRVSILRRFLEFAQ